MKTPYVLVVDDNSDGREMLSEFLVFKGLRVLSACTGAEALEVAFREPPALVLMDLSMPEVDGWEATRRLRADPRTKDVIVVAVTARAFPHDHAAATLAGCDAFVIKPYELASVATMVERILAQGRSALAET